MSLRDEIQRAVEESSRKLQQRASPPVKYWLLRRVEMRDREDILVQRTLDDCAGYPPRLRLLRQLREDGTWPIPRDKKYAENSGPGPPIGDTYRTMLFNLHTLRSYVTSSDEGNVSSALARILSWQTKEGYIPGPWTDAFPLPHFNAHASHCLHTFGLGNDNRTKRLVEWLLAMQRHDGGWNIPFEMDVHYLPEYRAMRINDFREFIRTCDKSRFDLGSFKDVPSCIWCTMLVVWGFAENGKVFQSKQVRKGAEFFLDRFFKRNPHPNFYLSESHWTRLKYPSRFGSGLTALSLLSRLGYGEDDPRMERPIRWLLGLRSQDGFWAQTGRPSGDADQWLTLIAIATLKRFAENQ